MPSLKEIKTRIQSVNSTRKITSAMKMVASSKLHHAQVMIENMLPYETMIEKILKTFLASEADASSVLTQERPVKRVALVVYSSNSSLCGGFNANVIKMMQQVAAEYESLGKENIVIYPIGRKVAEKAAKLGFDWSRQEELVDKIQEELNELREAMKSGDDAHIDEELGDLLFAASNLSRFRKRRSGELLLGAANRKFKTRFMFMEKELAAQGKKFEDCNIGELEALWQKAKGK